MGEWENGGMGEETNPSPTLPLSHSPTLPFLFLSHSPILPFILGLLILPYFINLSGPSLWDSTEAFYAETPREMMERGSFIVPYFNDEPRLNKPPLSYYLVLPFYYMFGVSHISERVVNALGAGLLILLTFAVGRMLFNQRAGLFSAAVMATTPRLVLIAQKSIIDTYFTLFVAAALVFFWRIVEGERARAAVILFYVALGLGVLAKGPLAIVLPGGVIFCYLLVTRQWARLRHLNLPLGALVLAAVVLPWYVAVYLKLGWEPIATFIFRENVGRFTSDVDWSNRGPFYYVSVWLGDFFPWSLLLIPAGLRACTKTCRSGLQTAMNRPLERPPTGFFVRALISYRAWRDDEDRQPIIFLWLWMAFIFVFFSLARNKHEYYILPIYPAAAVLAGQLLSRLVAETVTQSERRALQIATVVVGILLAAGSVVLGLFFKHVLLAPVWSYALPVVLFIGALGIVVTAHRRYLKRMPSALIGLMLAAALGYELVYLRVIEPFRPTKPLCQVIEAQAQPADLVGYYKFAAPSMAFYLKRKVFEVHLSEFMRPVLQSDRRIFCIVPEREWPELEHMAPGRFMILDRRPTLTFRLNALMASQPQSGLPHVLLVSTRPH